MCLWTAGRINNGPLRLLHRGILQQGELLATGTHIDPCLPLLSEDLIPLVLSSPYVISRFEPEQPWKILLVAPTGAE